MWIAAPSAWLRNVPLMYRADAVHVIYFTTNRTICLFGCVDVLYFKKLNIVKAFENI